MPISSREKTKQKNFGLAFDTFLDVTSACDKITNIKKTYYLCGKGSLNKLAIYQFDGGLPFYLHSKTNLHSIYANNIISDYTSVQMLISRFV